MVGRFFRVRRPAAMEKITIPKKIPKWADSGTTETEADCNTPRIGNDTTKDEVKSMRSSVESPIEAYGNRSPRFKLVGYSTGLPFKKVESPSSKTEILETVLSLAILLILGAGLVKVASG